MIKEDILKKMKELVPWGQNIQLAKDIYTKGPLDVVCRWEFIKNLIPRDLKGMHILDIGCNAGYFSVKMKRLGAQYIKAIDFKHYIKQAKFLAKVKKCDNINFVVQSLYNLDSSEKFDLTICLGVLYHLKYPFLALKKISDVTNKMVILETEVLVNNEDTNKMRFIENSYRNDGTTWWIPGEECLKAMLRSVGFKFVQSYPYKEDDPIFGRHYSQGLTEEGIPKGRRMVLVGLKKLDQNKIGHLVSEIPELENELDFNNLDI